MSAGFEAQQVAFRGMEAVTEIIAGCVDVQRAACSLREVLSLIKEGKLAALAISAGKRIAALPDVPTTVEAGLPPDAGLSVLHRGVSAGENAGQHRGKASRRKAARRPWRKSASVPRHRADADDARAVRQFTATTWPGAGEGGENPDAVEPSSCVRLFPLHAIRSWPLSARRRSRRAGRRRGRRRWNPPHRGP